MTTLAIIGLAAPLAHAACDGITFPVSYRRVGGLHFLKLYRLTLSWSLSAAYKPL